MYIHRLHARTYARTHKHARTHLYSNGKCLNMLVAIGLEPPYQWPTVASCNIHITVKFVSLTLMIAPGTKKTINILLYIVVFGAVGSRRSKRINITFHFIITIRIYTLLTKFKYHHPFCTV